MQLSVIILNYNVRYFLELCLQSVQEALIGIESEIIVVDNASSDDSCDMIKQQFPFVILIENSENFGFPKGNNIGVSVAKGEYICILNPDTVVPEDAFQQILNFTVQQSNSGIVGCKLIDGRGTFLPESKRGIPTPWVAFTKVLGLYRYFPKNKLFNQYYAQHLAEHQSGKVSILVGAFMVMKRELYLEIGGFDENCFMYSDDIDLSYMVLQKGLYNYYYPDIISIHYKGESTIRDLRYMERFQEAMTFFYTKHFKINALFSAFMKLGIFCFSLMKKRQGNASQKIIPHKYFLVSNNIELKKNIELTLNKVALVDENQLDEIYNEIRDNPNKLIEIIFDSDCISFKLIIHLMEKLKAKNCTFKIHPKQSDFIIGSNSNVDRGEVFCFTKNIQQ